MPGRVLEKPWTIVAADLMHFPRSSYQNKYLMVFQDLFTKWIELRPLRAATGKNVTAAFKELILYRWNTLIFLVTDNGPEFKNETLEKSLREHNVRRVLIPPHFPAAHPVERANRTLKTMIAIFVGQNHRTWDKHLHELRHAFNTATRTSTRVSPAFLNFGRHPMPPKSLRSSVKKREMVVQISELQWLERLKVLDALRDAVYKHINEATEKQKEYFNKGRRLAEFNVGDEVIKLMHTISKAARGIKAGQNEVFEKKADSYYVLGDKQGNVLTDVHASQIKHYVPPREAKSRTQNK